MKQENQVLINCSEMTVNYTAMHCNTLHYTVEYTATHCSSETKQGLTIANVIRLGRYWPSDREHTAAKSITENKYKCRQ